MSGKIFTIATVGLLLVAAVVARTSRLASGPPMAASGISLHSVAQPRGSTQKARLVASYGKLPLSFEANRGQADAPVKFLARGSGYALFLLPTEAVLALRSGSLSAVAARPSFEPATSLLAAPRQSGGLERSLPQQQPQADHRTLRMQLIGANHAARIVGQNDLPGKVNYFRGNDPQRWRTYVPTYAKVKYAGVYPGIDLVYYGNRGQLEYDFAVAPGADPGAIRLAFRGADKLVLDADGSLGLCTQGGEVQFHKPVAYQQVGNAREEVAARYVLRSNHEVGFRVAPYDASQPLILDPVLVYSTYLGGSNDDASDGLAIALNPSCTSDCEAFIAGSTFSTDFPITSNAFQATMVGVENVFVTKLAADGKSLVYSTYLGGVAFDQGFGIAVDSAGSAYVTGAATSFDFPTTPGTFQTQFKGGLNAPNAFLTKLSPAGNSLVYSTYLGGSGGPSGGDNGNAVAVDSTGHAYIGGSTGSANFPTTAGAFQTTASGGLDAFVTKFAADGASLVYSTYLGGDNNDQVFGVAVDSQSDAYVTGSTASANFPTTTGAFQTTLKGLQNPFVAKLTVDGKSLIYSTFLDGNTTRNDFGTAIAVDSGGNAYVTGLTNATDFPTTTGAFQTASGGFVDGFVTKLAPDGKSLVYSTYLGGNGFDAILAIALDSANNAYVTGLTLSNNFPSVSPVQATIQGSPTAFVTEFNAAGTALNFSTYLGGSGGIGELGSHTSGDVGLGIAVDPAANVYVAGSTGSHDFPTANAFQPTIGAGTCSDMAGNQFSCPDAFIAKIGPANVPGVAFGPGLLDFGGQTVGIASGFLAARLLNAGSAALNLSGISVTGANAADFSESDNCGTSLAGGAECTIKVTFMPMAAGAATAAVAVSDNAADNPQSLALAGVGVAPAPVVTLSPPFVNFAAQPVGTTSAPQSVTVSNTGTAALNLTSVAITGTNSTDFALASGTTCAAGGTVATSGSCVINVTFTPTAAGTRVAAVTLTDNANDSPQSVGLAGATPPPDFSISASSTSQTINAGQTATFPLTLSGSNGFGGTVALSCSDPIPASSCSFSSSSVTLSGSTPATVSVSVSTTARSVLAPPVPGLRGPAVRVPVLWLLVVSSALLASALRGRSHAHRHVWAGAAGLLLFAALSFACGGCGSSTPSGTPPGSFTVTVTGTGQGASHSAPLNVTVK